MSSRNRKHNMRHLTQAELRGEFEQADSALMEAIVAGCALVANADGWVAREERRRMNGMVRALDPVAAFGGDEVEAFFKELNRRFSQDHDDAERHALSLVEKLRGRQPESDLLITVCQAIAGADGGYDAEERQALLKLCAALDLDPATFELTPT